MNLINCMVQGAVATGRSKFIQRMFSSSTVFQSEEWCKNCATLNLVISSPENLKYTCNSQPMALLVETLTSRQTAAVHFLHVMVNRAANITCLPFQTEDLTSLFAPVEAWFQVKNIYKECDWFNFAITILSKEVIQLCFAVMVYPNNDN